MPSRARSSSRNSPPTWKPGYVDPGQDHFELRYGQRQRPIARVGRSRSGQVLVQYLMKARGKELLFNKMLNDVNSELTYYLFGALGSNAWTFARFHCDTPANISSQVHWRWRSNSKDD